MRRKSTTDEDYRKRVIPKRPRRWAFRFLFLFLALISACLILTPHLLSSPGLVNAAIERFGGLAPLKVNVGRVSIGWFSPASAGDVELIDASGHLLASIRSISTEKGIIGWAGQPMHLGTVTIDGIKADIVASEGTTNLESAVEGLLQKDRQTPEVSSDRTVSGSIAVSNASVRLRRSDSPQAWLIELATANVVLPAKDQLLGPVELKARVTGIAGAVDHRPGEILAKAEQMADGAIELRAKLDDLPLDVWHILHARLPWIPVLALTGRASGMLAGNARDSESWTFDLQQVQVQDLEMSAPELIGPAPARLNSLVFGGRVGLTDHILHLADTRLECDVGSLTSSASFPWPLNPPTWTHPFIEGANFSASGVLDLPQLVQAAQSLLPIREDVQLVSGKVQFTAAQNARSGSPHESRLQIMFSDMQAVSQNQPIIWKEPLTMELVALQQPTGFRYDLGTKAEFCDLHGAGTFENGLLAGNVNLDLLHRRLSQFMDLPISTMTGSASVDVQWQLENQEQVAATGTLQVTPLMIVNRSGGQMREPAWNGNFHLNAGLKDGIPVRINQSRVELIAPDEQLVADLHEPICLDMGEEAESLPPAAFSVAITGDLANWKRRGWVRLSEPPDIEIGGNIQMAVSGKMDLQHVEILQANWDSKPMSLRMSDMALSEPQMIGNFKGRIDTSDLTRLQVEQLTVQANSFWVVAQDEAVQDGNARSGKARWMLDAQRFMQNLNSARTTALARSTSPGILASGVTATSPQSTNSSYSATGNVQGTLNWVVGQAGASFALQANGENVSLTSLSDASPASQALWNEPTVAAGLEGKWTAADGSIDLSTLQFNTQWLNYLGNLKYQSVDNVQSVVCEGQAAYDAALLTTRLEPIIGSNFKLHGQQTVPVMLQWRGNTQSSTPLLAGLNASTRLGWQQARVVGIDVGRADVPVSIESGRMSSAAEIPVSGGKLKWDIVSDLTQETLVIEQKPMVVLENVAITPEMCSGWLKYVAPLLAETTSIDGRLSLEIQQARLQPLDLANQTVDGRLIMHRAEVGPGPLANEVTGLIRQIEAIRRADPSQAASAQNRAWMKLPEQQISFRMIEGKVYHRDLRIEMGEATLTTAGWVDTSGQLDMLVYLPIPDAWTQRGPVLAAFRGQTLQFPMRGSVSRPQLDASLLGQLGRQTIENAAQGLLQQGINRGLERLFKQ